MVHQFKNNGFNIVMDVNSGAIHVVDDIVYDIIALYEGNSEDQITAQLKDIYDEADIHEGYAEVTELNESGCLFTEDHYLPYLKSFDSREIIVKALCLNVVHDCNLGCRYCFAGEGEYKGERGMMSYETGKKAFDFLVANSGSRKHLEVDFFGGEPTMNFDVVKKLVEYGRELEKKHNKEFRFTLTTNGLLLNDEMLDYINKEMSNVVLSIDGRRSVNDMMRPFRNGAGDSVYDLIVPKYQKVAESRGQINYYVRGTFTHNNLDFAEDVLHLADLGFKQISIEPVVAPPEEDYAIKEEDIPAIIKEYDRLAVEIVKRKKEGRDFNFFHFMIDLDGGPCVAKRLQGCGSGCEYVSIVPNGDIYPCHQFVGTEGMKMGDVDTGIVTDDLRHKFHTSNVYTKPECQDCFAKFYCSGGCAANSYNFTGDINGNYEIGCDMQRKRVECSIMIKAAEAQMRAESGIQLERLPAAFKC
ncbi:MAG: thioether cross-link-forming SCIFF peptide maturase [Clostridiales bacterium]|nr:thioether cross-link-forming SCIFF peptide maturase [Clostridiales bacterium]MBS5878475.1 thioether cross-link-forming SCIFF peptide maturase [Clostridiales bacterium]MDU3490167.1 thioether cross-link-forming SCIFF peptide maturase [Clostridiales bacterium]